MKGIDMKDVLIRSIKTFLEVVLTYVATAMAGVTYGDGTLSSEITVGALLSAGAAGIAAVLNGVVLPLLRMETRESEA